MSEVYLGLTGGVIALAMVRAYWISRDALHPLMYLGPMIAYKFVLCPWVLLRSGSLGQFFPDPEALEMVLLLDLLGVGAFCGGCLSGLSRARGATILSGGWDLAPLIRRRLYQVAVVLGSIAFTTSTQALVNAGGIFVAFSRAKGGGAGFSSGYLNEAALLSFPAIVLIAVARRGQRMRGQDLLLIAAFIFHHLLAGVLGTRRGPLFQSLATLGLAYCIWRFYKLDAMKLLAAVAAIGLTVLFVFAHRSEIFIGSDFEFELERFWRTAFPREANLGDDFVVAAGTIIVSNATGHHYWGSRFLVTFLVRPIPKQIWPTKYQDVGFGWMRSYPGSGGIPRDVWQANLGWHPYAGSATGFLADLFLEFSWGAVVAAYFFGCLFGVLWRKAARDKGLWIVLYLELAALSIYVPTQSVCAVLHRFLFMAAGSIIFWNIFIRPLMGRFQRRPVLFASRGFDSPQAGLKEAFLSPSTGIHGLRKG